MGLLNHIQTKHILVVGDIMLDTYFTGEVKRISPEAPVPVFCKQGERSVLGGAANVAANLVTACQSVSLMAILGEDEAGAHMRQLMKVQEVDTSLVFSLPRHTTQKIRLLTKSNQQIIRLDEEDTKPIDDGECVQMLIALRERIGTFDLVLLSDYLKGLLTPSLTQGIIKMAKESNIPVIIDVKDTHIEKYAGATLLKPNTKELSDITGMKVTTDEEIIAASGYLRDRCLCDYVLTTCGSRGMVLVGEGEPYFIDSVGEEVFDVTGAGDTAIAYLAACMVNGADMRQAVDISNIAAGVQVSKVGTSSVCWSEIRERLTKHTYGLAHKIIDSDVVASFRKAHEAQKVVFTNGCFDILHVGHIRYLQEAAKLGDILIVGLNSDASVKRLKGPERPVNSELERAEMLSALGFVDYVVIFEEDTPLALIKQIQPDILVKGGDYAPEAVVGREEVEARGGRLVLIPFVEGKSTTNLIQRIKR